MFSKLKDGMSSSTHKYIYNKYNFKNIMWSIQNNTYINI